jgi:hypothetical protein
MAKTEKIPMKNEIMRLITDTSELGIKIFTKSIDPRA